MEIDQQTQPATTAAPPPQTFKTTISKQPFYYFAVSLVTADQQHQQIDIIQYRNYLSLALNQWLGATGAGISIDVLKFDYPRGVIRVPYGDHRSVWQALTVYGFQMPSGG
ncbi:hypothetical protein GQ54DRAFT_175232, partial [Martensiomyces pterosporus]